MGACCVRVTMAVPAAGAQKKCVPANPPHEISPSCFGEEEERGKKKRKTGGSERATGPGVVWVKIGSIGATYRSVGPRLARRGDLHAESGWWC